MRLFFDMESSSFCFGLCTNFGVRLGFSKLVIGAEARDYIVEI